MRHKCPLDNTRVSHSRIVPNRVVQELVDDLPILCRYGVEKDAATGVWSVPDARGDMVLCTQVRACVEKCWWLRCSWVWR